jgi:hypothetical protein
MSEREKMWENEECDPQEGAYDEGKNLNMGRFQRFHEQRNA